MDFRILGPLEVLDEGRSLALAGSKPSALLALLLLHASNQGLAALPGYAAYHAAKGAVVMMTKSGAVTYGPYGIRVNSVCPGMVETPMSEGHEANQPMIDAMPLRRGATPEEIAPGVLFLASDESRVVTGTELIMDGGYLAV